MSAPLHQLREQLVELSRQIASLAAGRRERLRFVTIVASDQRLYERGPVALKLMLMHRGITTVDVAAVRGDGPLRIMALEFDPPPE